ncbi:N-acetylmuramoyl-L-alanine amidase [Nakamurella deserti]|uniref:N-acetylmuramoyl-L-alanine amidase n=1 Tax=Nakamurella deserti TaxID=2164074 RepID=UPI0014787716|nr:N-acetylmuramoyl-L-alanine amidase [Nakamurella deserti]
MTAAVVLSSVLVGTPASAEPPSGTPSAPVVAATAPVAPVAAPGVAPEVTRTELTLTAAVEAGADSRARTGGGPTAPDSAAGSTGAAPSGPPSATVGAPALVAADSTVEPFDAIGFSYAAGTAAPVIEVTVRENGTWSSWEQLEAVDGGPDADTAEAARAASSQSLTVTEPLLVSGADAYRVRVMPAVGAPAPAGFAVTTVDAGTGPGDAALATVPPAGAGPANPSAAAAAPPAPNAPAIITRAEWGADESLREKQQGCDVEYNSTIKVGFVHHVASTNTYDAAGTAAEVRSIYAYQVLVNGWCDVGYNFLVDKFGRVYEGRWGGVDRAVKGAHTGGFNTDSFGVSAIGNYETVPPTDALLSGIAHLLGWKLGLHNRDPFGRDSLVGAGGGTSKYPAGQRVTFDVVSGHRDAGNTLCPGEYLYPRLPELRVAADRVARQTDTTLTGAAPALQQVAYAGAPAPFTAMLPSAQPWEFSVVEESTGAQVRRVTGYAERGPFPGAWDLLDDSLTPVRGGMYTWYLRTAAGGLAAGRIEVVPPTETARGAAFSGGITAAGFVPVAPSRIYDSRSGRTQPLGPGSSRTVTVTGGAVPADARGVALNVTAVDATQPSHLTAWPAGAARPSTSSLNVGTGTTVPGLVVVPIGSGGGVTLGNNAGSVHLVVDVVGYFTAAGGSGVRTTAPTRLLDGAALPMSDGQTRTLDVAGALGVDRSAMTGAIVNVTLSQASRPGNVSVQPAGAASASSTANVVLGRDVTNRTLVAVADGRISVRNVGGDTRVYVDVVGWFGPGGARYTSVPASRVLDTRYGPGRRAPLGAGEALTQTTAGAGGTPADATAVLGTLTSDGTSAPTHFRVWATGGTRPTTSDLNPWPGVAAANAVLLPVGTDRSAQIFNNSGSSHVIVDVVGYFS